MFVVKVTVREGCCPQDKMINRASITHFKRRGEGEYLHVALGTRFVADGHDHLGSQPKHCWVKRALAATRDGLSYPQLYTSSHTGEWCQHLGVEGSRRGEYLHVALRARFVNDVHAHLLQASGLRVSAQDFGFRVSGFGCKVSDFGFRVSGFGFQIQD